MSRFQDSFVLLRDCFERIGLLHFDINIGEGGHTRRIAFIYIVPPRNVNVLLLLLGFSPGETEDLSVELVLPGIFLEDFGEIGD